MLLSLAHNFKIICCCQKEAAGQSLSLLNIAFMCCQWLHLLTEMGHSKWESSSIPLNYVANYRSNHQIFSTKNRRIIIRSQGHRITYPQTIKLQRKSKPMLFSCRHSRPNMVAGKKEENNDTSSSRPHWGTTCNRKVHSCCKDFVRTACASWGWVEAAPANTLICPTHLNNAYSSLSLWLIIIIITIIIIILCQVL